MRHSGPAGEPFFNMHKHRRLVRPMGIVHPLALTYHSSIHPSANLLPLPSIVQLSSTRITESPRRNLEHLVSLTFRVISLLCSSSSACMPLNHFHIFPPLSSHFLPTIPNCKESNSHLTNEPILINRPALLSLRVARRLGPHLLHVLQYLYP